MGVLALVGTRKGLFMLRSDDGRKRWQAEGPLLDGWGVYHAVVDERDGTVYAAANHCRGPLVSNPARPALCWQRDAASADPARQRRAGWPLDRVWEARSAAGRRALGAERGAG